MNTHYDDIIEQLGTPLWFDENAVPRYREFSPGAIADIYAREVALVLIECQSCGELFQVAISFSPFGRGPNLSIAERIRLKTLDYGDPPNVGCCGAGPTMTSISRRVLQYWTKPDPLQPWQRKDALEVAFPEE